MDFKEYGYEMSKLMDYLRESLDAGAGFGTLQIFGHLAVSSDELRLIINRIEKELEPHNELSKNFFDRVSKGLEPELSEMEEWSMNLSLLSLDIKSFIIFTRIFCDTLCRFIRLTYGEPGFQLPQSMNDLLESEKALEIDEDFFSGLNGRMNWFRELRGKRVEIEHYLGGIRKTPTRNGSLGFDIISMRDKGRSWGTDTVQSISDFIQNTINSLTEVLRYVSMDLSS